MAEQLQRIMCGVMDLAFRGPPLPFWGAWFAISSLFRAHKWVKQLNQNKIYMQSELITSVTAFTACGAAVSSGQTEAAQPHALSLFLRHVYDPLFLRLSQHLPGFDRVSPMAPSNKKTTAELVFPRMPSS